MDIHIEKIAFWETVMCNRKLSDGSWHHVVLEINLGQMKITIDGDTFLYDVVGEMGPWSDSTQSFPWVVHPPSMYFY